MDPKVYGESARAILRTMSKSERGIGGDGLYRLRLTMPADEAGPVTRALMRAEAELLQHDADEFDPGRDTRTPEQRRADAMVEVVSAAAAALEDASSAG